MKTGNYIFLVVVFSWLFLTRSVLADERAIITGDVQMSITLATKEKAYNLGQPIGIVVCLTNSSVKNRFCGDISYSNDAGVGFIVTDPTGRDVSPVFPQNGGEGATQLIVVPPGKNERFNYDLNELYKLGFFPNIVDSGEYVIVARMHMGDVDTKKSFVVYSNKIKVTLHPEFE